MTEVVRSHLNSQIQLSNRRLTNLKRRRNGLKNANHTSPFAVSIIAQLLAAYESESIGMAVRLNLSIMDVAGGEAE